MNRMRNWVNDYPLIVWLLGLGSFINVGGLSLLWPVNAIYIHTVLNKPLTVAGLVLMVYSGAGLFGSFFGGWLYDRLGAIPVLAMSLLVSSIVILLPVFSANWYLYIGVMAVFGATCAAAFPILNALVGHAWPEGGRRSFNFLYVANNLGVAVGTAIGGVLAQWSFHAVFIGISVGYVIFLVLVFTVFRKHFARVKTARKPHAPQDASGELPADMLPTVPWVPIAILFIGFIVAWAIYVQWQSTISVFMQSLGYPLASYSVLWTLNGVLIFLAQPLVSLVVRKVPNLSVHMMVGTALYAVAYLFLTSSRAYPVFVVAMIVMTLGELLVWPSVPAAVAQIAPAHRLGVLQGMVGSAATCGRMLGPVIGGYMYDHVPMNNLLIALSAATMLPVLSFVVFGRLVRQPATMPPNGPALGA